MKQKLLAGTAVLALIGGGSYLYAAIPFVPNSPNQPAGYVGQPAATSTDVRDGNQKLFVIDYSSQDWSGNIHSYNITSSGTASVTDNWGEGGGAQRMIDAQNYDTGRSIVTRNGSTGIPFRWLSLSTVQQTGLGTETVLNYVRGDKSNQMTDATTPAAIGENYRYRAHVMGDIIHSTPKYCPAAQCGAATVFVGANDGMLHAINTDDGSERFAYIPSMLIPQLKKLKEVPYQHTHFVDGRMDIRIIGGKTILVGALGAGGKGLYALDVSDAAPANEAAAASKILWEITNTGNFSDLGDTYGTPTLTTLQDGTAALIVGNGYNNEGTGTAVLYIIDPLTGARIDKIDTGSGSAASPNGLSTPSLWDSSGAYGNPDTAYAGDIDGNLWKFDLINRTAVKLFTTSPAQAITSAPGLMKHTINVTVNDVVKATVMVTFATGKLFTTIDKGDATQHFAYGIWDKQYIADPGITDGDLLAQTLTEASYTGTTPENETLNIRVRQASTNNPDWNTHKGWKTPFSMLGERLVGDGAYVTDGVFQFVTHNPTVNPTIKPYGENWWMQLNAMNGGDNGRTLMDLNRDGLFTGLDQITGGIDPVGRHMGGGGSSQLIGLSTSSLDVYQGNYDKNDLPETTTTQTSITVERGVSGGHFDFDFYCNPSFSPTDCSSTSDKTAGSVSSGAHNSAGGGAPKMWWVHMHEYDDIYDKTGVNMLSPSQKLMRLARAFSTTTSTSTPVVGAATIKTPSYWYDSVSSRELNNYPRISSSEGNEIVVSGYPLTVVDEATSTITVTNKTTQKTTRTSLTVGDSYTDNRGRTRYKIMRQVDEWTTTTTTVTVTVTNKTLGFKILVSNQAYSPAVELTIGGADATAVKAYDYQTSSSLTASSLSSYNLSDLKKLQFNLPLDGFRSQDWVSLHTGGTRTSTVRAGMHPTVPYCVISWGSGSSLTRPSPAPVKGPSGEWRNGALTIQIVKDDIADGDIRLNVPNKPELGYVLTEASQPSKLIAEYTTFWHAPKYSDSSTDRGNPNYGNGGWCMGEGNWNPTPPQDTTSDATNANPEPLSADPSAGTYGVDNGGTGTGANEITSTTTITTKVNPDGSTTTTTVVVRTYSDGSTNTTTTTTTVGTGTGIGTAQFNRQAQMLGRVNWREWLR